MSKPGSLSGLSDQTLANLLSVKSSLLYGQNFNVKVDENRFVGFSLLLDDIPDKTTVTEKTAHKARIFYQLIYKPSYCNFPESRKKIKKQFLDFFYFKSPTLNIICFVEKK